MTEEYFLNEVKQGVESLLENVAIDFDMNADEIISSVGKNLTFINVPQGICIIGINDDILNKIKFTLHDNTTYILFKVDIDNKALFAIGLNPKSYLRYVDNVLYEDYNGEYRKKISETKDGWNVTLSRSVIYEYITSLEYDELCKTFEQELDNNIFSFSKIMRKSDEYTDSRFIEKIRIGSPIIDKIVIEWNK